MVGSGRRRGRPRRPPTPPGIRVRTKAVPVKPLCFCLIACLPISAQPYLADSVRYLRLQGPLTRHLLKKIRNSTHIWPTGSALCRVVSSTHMASADFYQPIVPPFSDSSTWQTGRPPRVGRATFIPYTRRIYFYTFRVIIGLWILWPPRPGVAAFMRLLFVGPGLCLQLPSDSTSQWTPLLFG